MMKGTMLLDILCVLCTFHVANSFSLKDVQAEKRDHTLVTRVSYQECNLNVTDRLDCGYPGISEDHCNVRECCWSTSEDGPRCYHSIPTIQRSCEVESQERARCGEEDIRKEQCLALDCCWQPSNGGPSCYQQVYPPIYEGECGKTPISPATRNWRVIGGEESVAHSWPWTVSLQRYGYHVCGGSILNERWVLSAAHCASAFFYDSPDSVVVAGAHNIAEEESTTVRVMMEEIIANQDYYSGERAKDLLLIRLAEPLEFNDYIRPICTAEVRPEPETHCYSSGWGMDELYQTEDWEYEWGSPDELQQFMSPIVDLQTCNSTGWYDGMVPPTSICAGYEEGGRGNCYGDSGGPLMCFNDETLSWDQVGIVSWGMPCALARYPTVYASVADNLKWIREELAKYD